jgi:MoxR-like ATPase
MQGKPYFAKKLGRMIYPAPGFKVVATANSRGAGETDYAFTKVMNKAFLDRFKVTLEQSYPSNAIEKKILTKYMENNCSKVDDVWINDAVRFADINRKTVATGAMESVISTRRLVDMTLLFDMLGDSTKAVD